MSITVNNFSFSTFLSVNYGDSYGSGFRLGTNQGEYIITAKHVVFDNNNKLLSDLWIKSRNYHGHIDDAFSATVNLTDANVSTFNDYDLAVIKLDQAHNLHIETPGNDISFATLDDLLLFDDIMIASNILLVGFPSSLTVDNFYDVDRPLLRTGIVAGKNINNTTFVIDSLAFYGVSGGPVLQIDNNTNSIKIIGIVSRYIPFITEWKNKHERAISRQDFYNSGYAVCLPLDKILQYLL